jgi:hypothetical protein
MSDLLGAPLRYMDDDEENLAASIYEAIQRATNYSTRSMQSKEFKVGVSDLGFCSERTRRMLDQQVPDERDMLPAFIGTAIGDHAEQAILEMWPHAIRQAEVTVRLAGERGSYNVSGHPDLIVDNTLIDVKTSRGLSIARRKGPSQQQQFQRHCYAAGALAAGLFNSEDPDDIKVANVWLDRAADDRDLYVQMEPFDPRVVESAGWWLDDVIYAYVNGEEARKEPPRELCEKACGFYATCRALDTDVEGLLTDDTVLAAVDMYRDGVDMLREGNRLKDQAKAHLTDVRGSTGEYAVRWTHINGTHVEYDRDGYDRLDVRRIK